MGFLQFFILNIRLFDNWASYFYFVCLWQGYLDITTKSQIEHVNLDGLYLGFIFCFARLLNFFVSLFIVIIFFLFILFELIKLIKLNRFNYLFFLEHLCHFNISFYVRKKLDWYMACCGLLSNVLLYHYHYALLFSLNLFLFYPYMCYGVYFRLLVFYIYIFLIIKGFDQIF